jgi:hypothetical protein
VGAVGLAPVLVYWVAGLIGRAFRRKRGGRRIGSRPMHTEREEERQRRKVAPQAYAGLGAVVIASGAVTASATRPTAIKSP